MVGERAYIGLSSPIAYDWDQETTPRRSPNPLLEAPVGLSLLYDELWFYDPVVCPQNMRELNFVRFVTDEYDTEDLATLYEQDENQRPEIVTETPDVGRFPYESWEKIVTTTAPFAKHDDHGQGGDLEIRATPRPSIPNSKFDYFVSKFIDAEYITNTPLTHHLSHVIDDVKKSQTAAQIVDRAVCSGIPNYVSPEGPPLELIDDYRHHHHVKRFRSDVIELIDDPEAIEEEREKIAELAQEMQHEAIKKVSEPNRIWMSGTRLILNRIPTIGPLTGWVFDSEDLLERWSDTHRFGWASFYADLEADISDYEM